MTLEELQLAANAALAEITAAGSKEILEQARVKFLGRKGLITQALRSLGSLPPEIRPQYGQEANRLKKLLETYLDQAQDRLKRAAL
ncbi:MAG TPA: phenylalanine--tRNA ligase subunit alpha, partial [Thermodesulfobacteriota bacterium]|nr:phenylalanine--tRNA ligase subunit alpha [Thermodesulfobacteriota bacterium]